MYYEFFGLNQPPFRITPNTDFFFSGANRGSILEALMYAITQGVGMVKVTGEVGSGKTMLCNMLQSRLPDHIESVYLANPSVGPSEVLHAIAFELQVSVERTADRLEVMNTLQDFLLTRHAEGKRVVLFIEESQSMPLATLEEIRLLSNLETKTDKLLQIVMFGQPEFDETLRQNNMRQLRDRIAHSFKLAPLSVNEVREYLMFRMRAAGYRGPDLFGPSVVRQIAQASSGLTRRVNLIADKALLAAYSDNTHAVQRRHVAAALRDSEFAAPKNTWRAFPRPAWLGVALGVGAAGGVGLYAMLESTSATGVAHAHMQAPQTHGARAKPNASTPASATASAPSTTQPSVASAPVKAEAARAPSIGARDADATPTQAAAAQASAAGRQDAPADFVDARIAATDRWLVEQPQDTYSIQLLGATSEDQLRGHLETLSHVLRPSDVFIYRTTAQGKPSLTVLYGAYQDRASAERALTQLPARLRTNQPILRTVQGVRREIGHPPNG